MNLAPETIRKIKLIGSAVAKLKAGKKLSRPEQETLDLLSGVVSGRRKMDLPVYGSMAQCSSATGIPIDVLRRAKADGCKGFLPSKVVLQDVLPFLFQGPSAQLNLPGLQGPEKGHRGQFDKWRALREKLKFEEDSGLSISKDEVRAAIQVALAELFGTLDRVFCSELPPVVVGMKELEVRERCQVEIEAAKNELKQKFTKLAKETK